MTSWWTFKRKSGPGDLAHWVEVLAAKPDDVSLLSGTHVAWWKERTTTSTCSLASTCAPRVSVCHTLKVLCFVLN